MFFVFSCFRPFVMDLETAVCAVAPVMFEAVSVTW
jgi:hypothetical protein